MKLYLDTCCWCRPCDNHADKKVYDQAVAIMRIIRRARRKGHIFLSSVTLEKEIGSINDAEILVWVTNLYRENATTSARYDRDIFQSLSRRARQAGVEGLDVFHLCYAEASNADYLLTADEDFIEAAAGLNTAVKIINPLNFPIGGII